MFLVNDRRESQKKNERKQVSFFLFPEIILPLYKWKWVRHRMCHRLQNNRELRSRSHGRHVQECVHDQND